MLRSLGLSNTSLLWLVSLAVAAAVGCGSSRAPRAARQAGAHPPPRPIRLADLHGQIVFSRRDDIWSANADGSGLRRLTFGRGPEFRSELVARRHTDRLSRF